MINHCPSILRCQCKSMMLFFNFSSPKAHPLCSYGQIKIIISNALANTNIVLCIPAVPCLLTTLIQASKYRYIVKTFCGAVCAISTSGLVSLAMTTWHELCVSFHSARMCAFERKDSGANLCKCAFFRSVLLLEKSL